MVFHIMSVFLAKNTKILQPRISSFVLRYKSPARGINALRSAIKTTRSFACDRLLSNVAIICLNSFVSSRNDLKQSRKIFTSGHCPHGKKPCIQTEYPLLSETAISYRRPGPLILWLYQPFKNHLGYAISASAQSTDNKQSSPPSSNFCFSQRASKNICSRCIIINTYIEEVTGDGHISGPAARGGPLAFKYVFKYT